MAFRLETIQFVLKEVKELFSSKRLKKLDHMRGGSCL